MANFNPNSFSYSSLKMFENCPRKFAETLVYGNYKDVFVSANGDYGDRMHKEAQRVIETGAASQPEFEFLRPTLDTLAAIPGTKYTEYKLGLSRDGKTLEWNNRTRWFQGIADLAIVPDDGDTARVVDYKAGNSQYADTDQLELMAMLIMARHPRITKVLGALLFVSDNQMRKRNVSADDVPTLTQKYRERHACIIACHNADKWPMKESGLCRRHCVVVSCPHNGRR